MPEHDSTALPTVRRTLAQHLDEIHAAVRAQDVILFALAEALLSHEELDDLRASLSERCET